MPKIRTSFRRWGVELAGADLGLGLAQHVLLPCGAHEVVVLLAEARIVERLPPAELLIAGLDVDRGEGDVVVEVPAIDVDEDAVDRVDDVLEAAEVDVDHVVDLDAEQLLDRLERQPWAALVVGAVDLVAADALDEHAQIAGVNNLQR